MAPDIRRQGRIQIGNVEPSAVLTLQRSFEGEAHKLFTSPLMKLETGSPNYANLPPLLSWFEGEKMAEQSKMGSDTKKSFTMVDEGRNMENQVGIQIYQLNLIKIKKTSEKLTGRQGKSSIKERHEDDHLTGVGGREEFAIRGTPPNEGLL